MRAGFYPIAVDCASNRFTPKTKILELDLTRPNELQLLIDLLQEAVRFGLPCGTCSRAREQAIPGMAKAPPPLRDSDFLLGLPNLSGLNQTKVQKANEVYRAAVQIMRAIFKRGPLVVIENPLRSWLWSLLALLVKQTKDDEFCAWYFNMQYVDFEACMFGSQRNKSTRFLCSSSILQPLQKRCDGSHVHAKWGYSKHAGFATAQEAEYTSDLCHQYIALIASQVAPERLIQTKKQFRLDSLQGTGLQATQHPQLIGDFSEIKSVADPSVLQQPCKILPATTAGEEVEQQGREVTVGIYKTMQQHVHEAKTLTHPIESSEGLPSCLKDATMTILTRSPGEAADLRVKGLRTCIEIAEQLKSAETTTRQAMDSEVSSVTVNKRIELFRRLLADISFPDLSIVDALQYGVRLTGWEPESQLYETRWNPPTLSVEMLDSQALWRRKAMMGKPMSEEERLLAPQLWKETLDEVERGFLTGPHTEKQISSIQNCNDWSASRRFLLLQGEEQKPRAIDDFKASAVNSAFGSSSYLNLQDADFLSSFLMHIGRIFSSGTDIHPAWANLGVFQGRGVDLSKAYKQVAVHPESRKHAVVAVRRESGDWSFFQSRSLPFGASASVFAFNKLTKGIWVILCTVLCIFCTVFYDDFPVVEHQCIAANTTKVLDTFLDLLGWLHATTGKKAAPFDAAMTVLGVTFTLSDLKLGKFKVGNKEGRVDRMIKLLCDIRDAETMKQDQVAVLQGLLGFAGRFVLGRSLKRPMHRLRSYESFMSNPRQLEAFCNNTIQTLKNSTPRFVSSELCSKPLLIYTDGAWEGGKATWGAVVIDTHSGTAFVHAGELPRELVEFWKNDVGEQLICQIELAAFVLIRHRYADVMRNRACIAFVDNEAARCCLVKGSSVSNSMFDLTDYVSLIDASSPCGIWYERVCTHSNIADLPSRGYSKLAAEMINGQDMGDIPFPSELIQALTQKRPSQFP